MGGFYIVINFLFVIGKIYVELGFEDLLVEFGVYVVGFIFVLLVGK